MGLEVEGELNDHWNDVFYTTFIHPLVVYVIYFTRRDMRLHGVLSDEVTEDFVKTVAVHINEKFLQEVNWDKPMETLMEAMEKIDTWLDRKSVV
jgi:hypothetical protein